MYGYIYLTTNLVNGKMYVGQKKSSYFNPNYKGSGKILWRAIEKYGWDNFKVELLKECNSLEELNQSEINEIRRRDACSSPQYYNIASGGQGWGSHWNTPGYHEKISKKFSGEGNPFYGRSHSQESINQAKLARRSRYENDPDYRQRLSESQRGKKASQETREKMSKSISESKKGKYPFNNGSKVIYRDLSEAEDLLSQGFVRGDLPRRKRTPEEIQRIKDSISGLVCVTDGTSFTKVHPEEVQNYLDKGWRLGRPRMSDESIERMKVAKSGTAWVNNLEVERMVSKDTLDKYLSQGWSRGRLKRKAKAC